MKVMKKILVVLCIIIIAVGTFMLIKDGIKYQEGYTKTLFKETAMQYIPYIGVSLGLTLIYLRNKI